MSRRLFLLVFLASSLSCSLGKLTHLRNEFISDADRIQAESYLEGVTNATGPLLKMPPLLEPNTSPRRFVDEQRAGMEQRVIAGILVENHSKLRLTDPKTSLTSSCAYNHELNHVGNVEPGTFEVFAVDNGAYKHRGICGAFSWQISEPNGRPLVDKKTSTGSVYGRRLAISYNVPYNCAKDYPNSFSVNVWHALVNSSGYWKEPDLVKTFYWADLYYPSSSSAMVVPLNTTEELSYFDSHRFLLSGSIESGCDPLLTVKFLPGEKLKSLVWGKEKPTAQKHTIPLEEGIFEDQPTESSTAIGLEKIMHYSITGGLGLIAVILSVCLLKSVARRGREKRVAKFAKELAGIEDDEEE